MILLIVMSTMLLGLSLDALSDYALDKRPVTPKETIATTQQEPLPDYRSISFKVHIPDNTPSSETIYLVLLPFYDWDELQRIPMTKNPNGTWLASVELQEGAMIRYVYDRGWDNWAEWKKTRERFNEEIEILYRYLFVTSTTSLVEDTIARWNDMANTPLSGIISGNVTDSTTKEPIMDATISIGGVHITTNYDGSFKLEDVPVGKQRVTVLTTLGDYKYASKIVQVNPGETTTVSFNLVRAKKVKVQFNVVIPEDTPPGSVVKLMGNAFQMGAYHGPHPNYGFNAWSCTRFVSMNKVSENAFTATLELYESIYVQYMYTLGNEMIGNERTIDGRRVLRNFIVKDVDERRNETIANWRPPGFVAVTFNLTAPLNTPAGDPICMLNIGAPSVMMDKVGKNNWVFTLFAFPGTVFQYKYVRGPVSGGEEKFVPDNPESFRSIIIPENDTIISDTVECWRWYPKAVKPIPSESINVTFRVTVPPNTPVEDTIYLVGNSTELGSYLNPKAIPMTRSPTNDWLWEVEVAFDSPKRIEYRYTRGDFSKSECLSRTLDVAYGGQTLEDMVFSWIDIPFSLQRDFISAIYPVDYWTAELLALYKPTLTRIREHGAEWVVVTSVWSYSQVEPLPEIEQRPIKVGGVFTPTEDLIAKINMIHSMGMKAFILPQFNMEMTSNGSKIWEAHSNEWWDKWFEEAEKLYMYHAKIAQQTSAEMLLLPGPGFHIFPGEWQFEDPLYVNVFDQKMQNLIEKVRQHYNGLLVGDGTKLVYDFPSLLDFTRITSFDWGMKLNVSSNASVQEIKQALEKVLDNQAKPIFERYDKPVIIQLAYASVDNAVSGAYGEVPSEPDDPSTILDLTEQANIYEAFFQAILNRSWVAGLYDFSYSFIDLPYDEGPSIRAKPAETVVSKYYYLFDAASPLIDMPSQNPPKDNVQPDQAVTVSVKVTDVGSGLREVILSYNTNEGPWTNVTMRKANKDIYTGQIPGFPADTTVQYKIIAYDNAGHFTVNDMTGQYYVYTVIPEFSTWPSVILVLLAITMFIVLVKRKRSRMKMEEDYL
jgi:hypothetical protein